MGRMVRQKSQDRLHHMQGHMEVTKKGHSLLGLNKMTNYQVIVLELGMGMRQVCMPGHVRYHPRGTAARTSL